MTAAAPDTAARFHALAEDAVEDLLRLDPEWATDLGDHRFDDQLTDMSEDGLAGAAATLADHRDELDSLDAAELSRPTRSTPRSCGPDWTVGCSGCSSCRAHLEPVGLAARRGDLPAAVPGHRAGAGAAARAGGRLAAVPDRLATARATLRDMPRVHVETAVGQIAGLLGAGPGRDAGAAGPAPRTCRRSSRADAAAAR